MDSLDHRRRTSFDACAREYDAIRPGYPDAQIDDLVAALAPDDRIVEVGAGPGKATVPIARRGRAVVAIEPGVKVAEVLRQNVAGLPVTIVETTFEEWQPDGPFALVVAAQSFHWIDPAVRYAKAAAVLAPGGALALLRNGKRPLDPALREDLDRAYATYFADARSMRLVDDEIDDWTREIDASGAFGTVEVRRYPWDATYTTAEYLRLLDTYSDHAVLDPARKQRLFAAIASVIDGVGGRILLPYVAVTQRARRL
jgi:SAM-dependent methyltransferase